MRIFFIVFYFYCLIGESTSLPFLRPKVLLRSAPNLCIPCWRPCWAGARPRWRCHRSPPLEALPRPPECWGCDDGRRRWAKRTDRAAEPKRHRVRQALALLRERESHHDGQMGGRGEGWGGGEGRGYRVNGSIYLGAVGRHELANAVRSRKGVKFTQGENESEGIVKMVCFQGWSQIGEYNCQSSAETLHDINKIHFRI